MSDTVPIIESAVVVRRSEQDGPRGYVRAVNRRAGRAQVAFAGLPPIWVRLDELVALPIEHTDPGSLAQPSPDTAPITIEDTPTGRRVEHADGTSVELITKPAPVKEEPRLYELATDLTTPGPEVSAEQREADAMAAGLRQLADMLQANPALAAEFAYSLSEIGEPSIGRDALAAFARAALRAGAKVEKYFRGEYAGVIARFGPVEVTAFDKREEVCERVVVGTREVTEQVPDPLALLAVPLVEVTRTVEDVEWRCRPLLDASAPGGSS